MRKTLILGAVLLLVRIPLLALTLVQQKTWGASGDLLRQRTWDDIGFDAARAVAAAPDGAVRCHALRFAPGQPLFDCLQAGRPPWTRTP
jgi:hypothetical protein